MPKDVRRQIHQAGLLPQVSYEALHGPQLQALAALAHEHG